PGHLQQRLSLVRSPSGHSGERSILVPCPGWVSVTRHKQRPRLWSSSVHLSRSPATPTTLWLTISTPAWLLMRPHQKSVPRTASAPNGVDALIFLLLISPSLPVTM